MDCYFRQSWVDKRLSFEGYKGALALSIEMLRKIWKPDTYGETGRALLSLSRIIFLVVYNGKKSYLHTITTPNRFVRYRPTEMKDLPSKTSFWSNNISEKTIQQK